jgi:hypothetical protein
VIAELRAALVSDLDAATTTPVHNAWPDRFTAPCVAVVPPAGSYVRAGQTFGSFEVLADALLLVPRGTDAATALVALDSLIELVLANSADWSLQGVDSPSIVTVGAVEHLGTLIHLAKQSKLP